MNKKFVFAMLFIVLLLSANIASAIGFGGTIDIAYDINCPSGKAFNVTKRGSSYNFPFWVSNTRKPIISGKKILGVARNTNSFSCTRGIGDSAVPVTVYVIDNYGVSR